MPIKLIRIDNRLIHGQVTEGWSKFLNIDRIIVSNDDAINNPQQIAIFKMVIPAEINLDVLSIKETAKKFVEFEESPEKILILFYDCCDVLKFLQLGAKPKSINIGCTHYQEGKKKITETVYMDGSDIECFKKILEYGIELELRTVPGEEKKLFQDIIKV